MKISMEVYQIKALFRAQSNTKKGTQYIAQRAKIKIAAQKIITH